MPKYLAIDYLANALQQRRSAVLRMVLASPHEPECVESYLLKAGSAGYHCYDTPWQKEHLLKVAKKDAKEYLQGITPSSNELESFDASLQNSDIVPSSNPDSPLVSFDLWPDLEDEVTNCAVQALAPEKVQFTEQESTSREEENLLEETESAEYLQDIVKRLPDLNSLCSRFKVKLIQDPFLSNNGKPFDESTVFRNNLCHDMDEKQIWTAQRCGKENFMKLLPERGKETDLPLQTWEIEQPADTDPCTVMKDETRPKELEKILKLNKEDISQDMQMEHFATPKQVHEVVVIPEFKAEEETETGKRKHDFVTLNDGGNADQANRIGESLPMIEEEPLESPSDPVDLTTPPDTKLEKAVGNLAYMEMSPAEHIHVLTPGTSDKCLNRMRESEKVFSEVYAQTLTVPDISRNSGPPIRSMQSAMQSLSILHQDVEGCGLESDLPLDPLASSSIEMEKSQTHTRQLLSLQHTIGALKSSLTFEEVFHRRSPKGDSADRQLTDTVASFPAVSKPSDPTTAADMTQSQSEKIKITEVKDPLSPIHPNNITQLHQSMREGEEREAKPRQERRTHSAAEHWSSGLDEFLFLRTTAHHSPSTLVPPKTIVRAARVRPRPSAQIANEPKSKDSQTPPTCTPNSPTVLDVHLTEEFQEVVETVHSHAEPLLSRLKESGAVPVGKDLCALTVDFTRFLVKQAEMAMCDQSYKDDTEEKQGYVMVVCLHALVTAADLLLNCGLTAAVAHLSQTQEKHANLIGDALESARRYLFKVHFHFQQARVVHPKLSKLLSSVGQWLQNHPEEKGRARSLLLLNRYPEQVYREISEALGTLPSVRFGLYDAKGRLDMMEFLQNQDVVAVSLAAITPGFPWGEFDYVVEYEHRGGVKREDLYADNSRLKQHLALKMSCGENLDTTQMIPDKDKEMAGRQEQYAFIGGQKITRNVGLLQLLESRYNVLIYERDYSGLNNRTKEDSLSKMGLQPDLAVDERTCVILQGLLELDAQGEFDKLKDTVLAMSLKCQKCYIILHSAKASDWAFTDRIFRQLSLLFASTAHFTGARSEFQVKVLFSFTADDTAKLIRTIGDLARNSSAVWDRHEWTKRKWLTDEMSAHERFLLSFPCINSFSAQILLTAAPLSQLLQMSPGELKETCPWIPSSILNAFYRTVSWTSSVDQDVPVERYSAATGLPHPRPNDISTLQSARHLSHQEHPTSSNVADAKLQVGHECSGRETPWQSRSNDLNNRTCTEGFRETCSRDSSAEGRLQIEHELSARETSWQSRSCGFTANACPVTRNNARHQQQSSKMSDDTLLQMERASFENNQDFEALFGEVGEQKREHELHEEKITTESSDIDVATARGVRVRGGNSELENLFGDGKNRTRDDPLVSGKEDFGNGARHAEYFPVPLNRLQSRTSSDQPTYGDVSSTQHKAPDDTNRGQIEELRVQGFRPASEVTKHIKQKPESGILERAPQQPRRDDWRTLVDEDLQRCIQGNQPHEHAVYARPVDKRSYSTHHIETQRQDAGLHVDSVSDNRNPWETDSVRHGYHADLTRPAGYDWHNIAQRSAPSDHSEQQCQSRAHPHLNDTERRNPRSVQRPCSNVGVAQPLRRVTSVTATGEHFTRPGNINQANYRTSQSGHKRLSMGIIQPDKEMALRGERRVPSLEPSPEGQAGELSIFPSLCDKLFPFKKRRLTYEKVPGDATGQTRLFFQEK